jgi:hypothetical protein
MNHRNPILVAAFALAVLPAACGRVAADTTSPPSPRQPVTTTVATAIEPLPHETPPSSNGQAAAAEPDLSLVLPAVEPDVPPADHVRVSIDTTIDEGEWASAGLYRFPSHSIEALHYGFDRDRMVVRVDFAEEVLGDDGAGFDLYIGTAGAGSFGLTPAGTFLGFEASHVVSWRGVHPIVIGDAVEYEGLVIYQGGAHPAGFDGSRVEFAIPLADLGGVDAAAELRFRLVDVTGGPERTVLPVAGPGLALVPLEDAQGARPDGAIIAG